MFITCDVQTNKQVKIIRPIRRILIHYSFCVLNFTLAACRPNLGGLVRARTALRIFGSRESELSKLKVDISLLHNLSCTFNLTKQTAFQLFNTNCITIVYTYVYMGGGEHLWASWLLVPRIIRNSVYLFNVYLIQNEGDCWAEEMQQAKIISSILRCGAGCQHSHSDGLADWVL